MKTKSRSSHSFILLISLCVFYVSTNTAQNITENIVKDIIKAKPFNEASFILGSFLIDTENKTISNWVYWEEDEIVDGHQIHSNMEGYKVDTFIDPESTCLYIFDNYFGFKENYDNYIVPFLKKNPRPPKRTHFEIEGYNYMNGLYEKEGKFYRLTKVNPTQFEEVEMPKGLDFSKFTYVKGNPYGDQRGYLYNEDMGLYFFENTGLFKGLTKLAYAKDTARPVIRHSYCEYNSEVFLHKTTIGRVDQLTKFDLRGDGKNIWFTNGKKVFSINYKQGIELADMNKWIQLTYENNFSIVDDCIYIPASKEHQRVRNKVPFASPDSFILMDEYDLRKEPLKIKNVFIKHLNNYEPIDVAKYQLYLNGFYAYQGLTYYKHFLVKNDFDMPNLKWVGRLGYTYEEWLCDGKLLTHRRLLEVSKENPSEFKFLSVPIADIRNLKFVTKDILVDGINFYQFTYKGIVIIPLEKLWFDIKINLSESAY